MTALVVIGTSNPKAARRPHSVTIAPDGNNGLTGPTVFMGQEVQVIPKDWIVAPVKGVLAKDDLAKIERIVREALGL